ncbi:unnamed protein product [Lupinus luteus]|uniref:Uncharacterized protein n=1 Tax=Lupinus luteus TaxID=3873 RepID=A0AAV1X153_LUPLU
MPSSDSQYKTENLLFLQNMAEPGKERDTDTENDELSDLQLPKKSLAELNMLLVSLSLVSFSMDECMEYEEKKHNNVKRKVSKDKTSMSRLHMNGYIHEPKFARRSSSTRFHTTLTDCR